MGNCLVTKLNGTVNNPDLPKLGHLWIKYDTTGAMPYNGSYSNRLSVQKENNAWVTDSLVLYADDGSTVIQSRQADADGNGYIAPSESLTKGYFDIKDKYGITNFGAMPNNMSNQIAPIKIMLDDVKYLPKLEYIRFGGSHITGNAIDIFRSFVNFPNMKGFTLWSSYGVTGNLADFGPYIGLNTLSFKYTNVSGTIESLIEAQVAAGRVSGTLLIYEPSLDKCSFHGVMPWGMQIVIVFEANAAYVRQGSSEGALLATYANGTWTYEF